MGSQLDRRKVLKGCLAGLAGLSWAPHAAAATGAARAGITRLSERLVLLSGLGANVLALSADDGLVLVDGGAPERTDALLAALRELPGGGRVRTLFNTHCHREQTGANEALGRAGAKIVAHEKTRQRLATPQFDPATKRFAKARPAAAHPTETFYERGATRAGGERIEYGYLLQAHTDGDIYVHFREANVLAVGDAAAPAGDPVLDWFAGGWLGGRLDSLTQLIGLCDERTRVVASTGAVVSRRELQAEHEVLTEVFGRMVELIRKGYTTDAMVAEGVLEGLARTWSDPRKFVYDAHKGFWAHHNTLSHDIV